MHETPKILEVELTDNDFDGISFDWGEIADNPGITIKQLKAVQKKLLIEDKAGGSLSDSNESTDSTYTEESSEEDDNEGL